MFFCGVFEAIVDTRTFSLLFLPIIEESTSVPKPHDMEIESATAKELSTLVHLPALSPMEIFNLPLVNGYFLVDTRPAHQFNQGSIMLSVNCPPETPSELIVPMLQASFEEITPDVFDLVCP